MSFDVDRWQIEIFLANVLKDPSYAPYCGPCPGLRRMRIVAPYYWRCDCGAKCDLRDEPEVKARLAK